MPLFERATGGVVLSEAGRTLLPHAERVHAALRDAANAMEALRTETAGAVSIVAVGTLAGANLTPVLKRFAADHPKIDLSISTASSAVVSNLVRRAKRSLDCVTCSTPPPTSYVSTSLPKRWWLHARPNIALRGKGSNRWRRYPTSRGLLSKTPTISGKPSRTTFLHSSRRAGSARSAGRRRQSQRYETLDRSRTWRRIDVRKRHPGRAWRRSLATIPVVDLRVANPVYASCGRAAISVPRPSICWRCCETYRTSRESRQRLENGCAGAIRNRLDSRSALRPSCLKSSQVCAAIRLPARVFGCYSDDTTIPSALKRAVFRKRPPPSWQKSR